MDATLYIVFIAIGVVLSIIGFVGCVLPVLPGPPISFLALLVIALPERLLFDAPPSEGGYIFEAWLLVVLALLAVLILVADYLIPIYGTKKTGGSKYAVWGATIGLIAGIVFAGPTAGLSIVLGPFAGAVIGELSTGKKSGEAVRSGFGAFLGFIAGTFSKLLVSLILTLFFVWGAFQLAGVVF